MTVVPVVVYEAIKVIQYKSVHVLVSFLEFVDQGSVPMRNDQRSLTLREF